MFSIYTDKNGFGFWRLHERIVAAISWSEQGSYLLQFKHWWYRSSKVPCGTVPSKINTHDVALFQIRAKPLLETYIGLSGLIQFRGNLFLIDKSYAKKSLV